MLTQILSALATIKDILSLARALANFVEQNKNEAWFQDATKTFKDFTQKTPEERREMARNLRDLLGRL